MGTGAELRAWAKLLAGSQCLAGVAGGWSSERSALVILFFYKHFHSQCLGFILKNNPGTEELDTERPVPVARPVGPPDEEVLWEAAAGAPKAARENILFCVKQQSLNFCQPATWQVEQGKKRPLPAAEPSQQLKQAKKELNKATELNDRLLKAVAKRKAGSIWSSNCICVWKSSPSCWWKRSGHLRCWPAGKTACRAKPTSSGTLVVCGTGSSTT